MNELALFAGAGGGILGGKLLGWRTVCAVEIDPYAASVLVARQNDGTFEPFPIWDDVRTFDGRPWRGIVDVVSGGFPCQDISAAGSGKGICGERSGLWSEFARIISEVRPQFAFVENSPMLTARGFGVVLGNLAEIGYDAEWSCLSAAQCGAPHKRDRIWILAYSNSERQLQQEWIERQKRRWVSDVGETVPHPHSIRCASGNDAAGRKEGPELLGAARGQLWPTPCAMEPEKDIENLIARLGRTRKERGGGGAPNLGTMVKLFPTPKKRDSKGTSSKRGPDHPRHLHNLDSVVEMGIGQINGRLNPLWVEWLMGWPIGWTGLNALETGKYHEWRLQHSICYLTGSKEYKDETK